MAKESLNEVIEDSETDSLNSKPIRKRNKTIYGQFKKDLSRASIFENAFMFGLIPGAYIFGLAYAYITKDESPICCLCGTGGPLAPFYGMYLAIRFGGFRI